MFTSSSSSKVFNIFAHQNPQRSVGLGFLFSKVEQGWECDSAKLLCYSCLKTAVQLVLPYTQLFFSCSSGLLGLWVLAAWVCAAYSCFLSLSLIALPFDSVSFVFPFPWIALTIISSYRRHKCFQRCLHLPVLGRGGTWEDTCGITRLWLPPTGDSLLCRLRFRDVGDGCCLLTLKVTLRGILK